MTYFITFIKQNPEKLLHIISILLTSLIFPFIVELLIFLLQRFFIFLDSNRKSARLKFKLFNKNIRRELRKESMFFDENEHNKRLFYKNVPIYDKKGKKKSLLSIYRKKTYILTGKAGCGKSVLLKADYLHQNSWRLFFRNRNRCFLFLDSISLVNYLTHEEKSKELLVDLATAKYKSLYLFLDGVDEIGEKQLDSFYRLIQELSQTIHLSHVKLSCRTEYAKRHLERCHEFLYITEKFSIGDWPVDTIKKFAYKLISGIKKSFPATKKLPLNHI